MLQELYVFLKKTFEVIIDGFHFYAKYFSIDLFINSLRNTLLCISEVKEMTFVLKYFQRFQNVRKVTKVLIGIFKTSLCNFSLQLYSCKKYFGMKTKNKANNTANIMLILSLRMSPFLLVVISKSKNCMKATCL